jgi:hypothetical protein
MNIIVGTKIRTKKGSYKVTGVWSNDEVEFADIKTGEIFKENKQILLNLAKKNIILIQ